MQILAVSTSDVLSLVSLLLAGAAFYHQFLAKYDRLTCTTIGYDKKKGCFHSLVMQVSVANSGTRPILFKCATLSLEIPRQNGGRDIIAGSPSGGAVQIAAGAMETFIVEWPTEKHRLDTAFAAQLENEMDVSAQDGLPLTLSTLFFTMDGEEMKSVTSTAIIQFDKQGGMRWSYPWPKPWQMGYVPFHKRVTAISGPRRESDSSHVI